LHCLIGFIGYIYSRIVPAVETEKGVPLTPVGWNDEWQVRLINQFGFLFWNNCTMMLHWIQRVRCFTEKRSTSVFFVTF